MADRETSSLPVLPAGFMFDHIGYATQALDKDRDQFTGLGYRQQGDVFIDPIQGVRGCFMNGQGPCIELLENLPDADTLTPWINAGIRMYHMAYRVDDLAAAMAWANGQRARVIVAPIAATAFSGRRICFIMFRNGQMLELIENCTEDAP